MKNLIFTILLFSNTLIYSQSNDDFFLDFFDNHYKLTSNSKNNYLEHLTQCEKPKFNYLIKGIKFLNRKVELTDNPDEPAHIIYETTLSFNDSLLIENAIDSLNISRIDFGKNFRIHCQNKILRIHRYKLVADSSSSEVEFSSYIYDTERSFSDSERWYFESCLKKLGKSRHFILTDIYYYDPSVAKEYRLDFSIILTK